MTTKFDQFLGSDPSVCIPLDFADRDTEDTWCMRIGGRPPKVAGALPSSMRFFAAVSVPGASPCLAYYIGFRSFDDMAGSRGRIVDDGDLVTCVECGSIDEDSMSTDEPLLSLVPYERRAPIPDRNAVDEADESAEAEDAAEVYSGTKFGGAPYLLNSRQQKNIRSYREGIRLFLQIDFPARSGMTGTWPFGDGMFYVFVQTVDGVPAFKYMWEF